MKLSTHGKFFQNIKNARGRGGTGYEQICDRTDIEEVSELRLRYPNHHIFRQSVAEFVRSQGELDQPPYYLNH